MTTPVIITGFEYGVDPNTSGFGLIGGKTGTPVIDGTIKHTGAYSMRCQMSNEADYVSWTLAASQQVVVARLYVRWETLPSGAICRVLTGAQATGGGYIAVNTSGKWIAGIGGGSTVTLSTGPVANQWYCIDVRMTSNANPNTLDWKIDGVAQTQATGATAAQDITIFRAGSTVATTGDMYIDDIVVSYTSGDYPIGEGGTERIYPSSEGTHSIAAGTLQNNSGTDIDGSLVLANPLINDQPVSSADYIQQAANGTTSYAEVRFSDIVATHLAIIGAAGFLCYTSASTSANNGGCIISKDAFSTKTTIWGESGALADYSDGSTTNLYYKSAILAGVTDDTTVNALEARVGYSGDANPDPYWIDLWVEVAYTVSTGPNGTASITLGDIGISASGTNEDHGVANITLDTITPAAAGTVSLSGSASITLDGVGITAAGGVEAKGASSVTLEDIGISAAGAIGAAAMEGLADITLEGIGISASATNEDHGTASVTLDNTSITAAGTNEDHGTSSVTLADISISAAGTNEDHGAADIALDGIGISASGTNEDHGTASVTLDAIGLSTAGAVDIVGTSNVTLETVGLTAEGVIGNAPLVGEANITLDGIGLVSAGTNEDHGTAGVTLSDLALSGVGDVDVAGSAAITLDGITLAGEGVVGNAPIEGVASITLSDVGLTTQGTVEDHGAASITLAGVGLSTQGTVSVQGVSSITLDGVGLVAAGTVATPLEGIVGEANITLDDTTIWAIGIRPVPVPAGAQLYISPAVALVYALTGAVSLAYVLTGSVIEAYTIDEEVT